LALYRRCAAVSRRPLRRRQLRQRVKTLRLRGFALRHQLAILARSHRRFRPTDRLLWLLLQWLLPRWKQALVLVQPATVDRWYREGVSRCWRRRARRPGRPRIDSSCRDLIRRMAADNCLWGAPRIRGELLKRGIAISERTVSRYLRGRPPTRSQTWRTFFAKHFGDRTLISPVMFADPRGGDIVGDAADVSFRSSRRPGRFLWYAPAERPAPVRNHSPARVRHGNVEFVAQSSP